VVRNAYGRQLESSVEWLDAPALGSAPLEAVFIRAPAFARVGSGVAVLASRGGQPVLVEQGSLLAATFHPELTNDDRIHRRFLATVAAAQ
jgi:pyridoxal 5'-phosphate synthase pdxT subunit